LDTSGRREGIFISLIYNVGGKNSEPTRINLFHQRLFPRNLAFPETVTGYVLYCIHKVYSYCTNCVLYGHSYMGDIHNDFQNCSQSIFF